MLLDDLVDIFFIDVRVPDAFRIHDDAWPFLAAIKAARLIDPHLARSGKSERLDALLGVIAHAVRAFVGPARALARRTRSEERRVGTACVSTGRSRCSPYH